MKIETVRPDIEALVARAGLPTPVIGCTPLKGDASNRSYVRLHLASGSTPATLVLMQLAEPEAFKRSEEAVSSGELPVNELPFLNVQRYFRSRGLGVPEVYGSDLAAGLVLLEDLGDTTLWDVVNGEPGSVPVTQSSRVETFYRLAVEELVRLQAPDSDASIARCVAFGRRFDRALFGWELDHFLEYGIEARTGKAVPPSLREAVRREFGRLADELAAAPAVLVHRDYHSRNLMVTGGRLRLIDFQDALMGPRTYDLASLLRDSYVTLEEGLVDRLLGWYLNAQPTLRSEPSAFRRLFDLTSLQRNLKAAGRFVYIHTVKGRPTHLPYVAPTLRSVRRNLDKYPDLAELRDRLAALVPELA